MMQRCSARLRLDSVEFVLSGCAKRKALASSALARLIDINTHTQIRRGCFTCLINQNKYKQIANCVLKSQIFFRRGERLRRSQRAASRPKSS